MFTQEITALNNSFYTKKIVEKRTFAKKEEGFRKKIKALGRVLFLNVEKNKS